MSRLSGTPIRVGVAMALLASMFSSAAQSQQMELQPNDADAGSSYTLRKSTLWFNRYFPGLFTHGAAYADLDKDGCIDVAVASGTGQNARTPIKLLMNNCGGGFVDETATRLSTAQPGLIHARKALTGDYNRDGWPDVFIVGHGYDQPPFPGEYPQLFLSNGDGTLRYDASLESHVGFHHAAASGDIDRNDTLDILVVQQGSAFFLINNGIGVFTKDSTRLPAEVLYKNFFTGEMADIDQDGYLDVLLGGHEFEGAPNTIYWGDASGAFSALRKTVLPEMAGKGIVMDFAMEDIDGDGRRDVVALRTGESPFYSGRALQIVRQIAARQFVDETGARMNMDTSQGWIDFIRVQDVNVDGRPDIFIDDANSQTNGQHAWTNIGQGVFSNHIGAVKPAPTVSITDASAYEGLGGTWKRSFFVRTSQPVIYPVTFDVYTANGSAVAGSDYEAFALEAVTLPARSNGMTVEVTTFGDAEVEFNEVFTVNLANASGAMLRDAQAVGSIVNDDLPLLSVADASVVEGNDGQTTMRFQLSLSHPSSTPVVFRADTRAGSASGTTDFVARYQPGRVFDAGRTRQTLEINVHGDTLAEGNEVFTVELSPVSGALIGDAQATGTILDDDVPGVAAPTLRISRGNGDSRAFKGSAAEANESGCRQLASEIARTEQRVASRKIDDQRGIGMILAAERQRVQRGCN